MIYVHMVCPSYGVVIREMWTRELPHEGLAEGAIMQKAFSGELTLSIPDSIPEAYKELLNGKPSLDIVFWLMLIYVRPATFVHHA